MLYGFKTNAKVLGRIGDFSAPEEVSSIACADDINRLLRTLGGSRMCLAGHIPDVVEDVIELPPMALNFQKNTFQVFWRFIARVPLTRKKEADLERYVALRSEVSGRSDVKLRKGVTLKLWDWSNWSSGCSVNHYEQEWLELVTECELLERERRKESERKRPLDFLLPQGKIVKEIRAYDV